MYIQVGMDQFWLDKRLYTNRFDFPLYVRMISHINRFVGAAQYSVAEHCTHLCEILKEQGFSQRVQAWALIHDLHEAIVGDVPTPLKVYYTSICPEYMDLERRVFTWMTEHLGLEGGLPSVVKDFDRRLGCYEADQILGGRVGPGWGDVKPAEPPRGLIYRSPADAMDMYFHHANRLRAELPGIY